MKTTSARVRSTTRQAKTIGNGNGQLSPNSSKARISSTVAAWLKKSKQHLIAGKWTPAAAGQTFDVLNPADGSRLTKAASGDLEDINRAVAAARRAFDSGPWRRMTPSERGKLVWRIGDLILEHADELAELESLDNGKPRAVARVADVPLAAGVWTRDIAKAHRIAAQLRAGTVWINCYNVFDSALPFGGYKQSGWGREMGREVLELYTETKAVVVGL